MADAIFVSAYALPQGSYTIPQRKAHLKELLRVLEAIKERYPDSVVILAGDINLRSHSKAAALRPAEADKDLAPGFEKALHALGMDI